MARSGVDAAIGLVVGAVLAAGCKRQDSPPPPPAAAPAAAPGSSPAAPPAPTSAPGAAPARPLEKKAGPLTWIQDDYPEALARARAAHLPLFVDLWAPWCHTCISMQETVLTDPAMAPFADRFVWLALDTEVAGNAPALLHFPPEAWPTFYVVSSVDESIQARQVGSASLAQLREILTAGELGHLDAAVRGGGLAADGALGQIRAGDRAAAAGDPATAARAFARALELSPPAWPRAPDVLVRQASALSRAGDKESCAELGERGAARAAVGHTASVADFASIVSGCADVLPADDAAALRKGLVREVSRVVADAHAALSADDRGDALAILRDLSEKLGQPAEARAYAIRQRDLLDAAAAAAPDPWTASTYNMQRADVHTYLGEGATMIPVLEKSIADLPREYDPPYRLAGLDLALERWDEGLRAAERALALATGPRRAQVLGLIAKLQHGRGDHAAERRARELALAHLLALPAGQRRPAAEAAARDAVSDFDASHLPAPATPAQGSVKP